MYRRLHGGEDDRSSFPNVTRITVVDSEYGRVFERYNLYRNGIELHLQDDGRTLKIFPRTNTPTEEEQ
jgi:hypothetical protein